jgi:putative zinc finger protein
VDCKTARQFLDFARPRRPELDAAELEELEAHLAECPDCGPLAQAERQMDSRLAQAMQTVPVPADLRGRVLNRLQSERTVQAQKRRRWIVGPAAAAVLLIAVGLGWKLLQKPSSIDVEYAADSLYSQIFNPQPQVLEDYFRAEGIRIVAPPDANYSLLRDYGIASFQGKQVARLLFTDGKSNTYVYILPARDFDVAAAMRTPVRMGSGWRADIRQDASGKYGYLVISIGDEPLPVFPVKKPPSET